MNTLDDYIGRPVVGTIINDRLEVSFSGELSVWESCGKSFLTVGDVEIQTDKIEIANGKLYFYDNGYLEISE